MKISGKLGVMLLILPLFFAGLVIIGCGDSTENKGSEDKAAVKDASGLTNWELKHGIGPVKKEITLGEIDKRLVSEGEKIFETKCAACHKLDERYVGPPQRDVLERRTPEFVLNMMLSPEENYKRHPEIKKLLGEYLTPMPNQNLTLEDALAVLEYFRAVKQ